MAASNPAPQWQTAPNDWQGTVPKQPQQGQWHSATEAPNLSIAANQGPAPSQWQPATGGPNPQATPLSLSQRMADETRQHNQQQGSHIPAQQQQKPAMFKNPAAQPANNTAETATDTGSEVERLVNRVVFAVLDKLNDDTFTEKFTKAKELLNDNRQLAAQIQQLLGQQQQQQDEVNHLTQQLSTFKKLIGNIYLKID